MTAVTILSRFSAPRMPVSHISVTFSAVAVHSPVQATQQNYPVRAFTYFNVDTANRATKIFES